MTDITVVRLPKIYLVKVHPFRSVGSGYDIRILIVSTLPTIYDRSLEFGRGIQNNNIKKRSRAIKYHEADGLQSSQGVVLYSG